VVGAAERKGGRVGEEVSQGPFAGGQLAAILLLALSPPLQSNGHSFCA
jgi:hypothetical protein